MALQAQQQQLSQVPQADGGGQPCSSSSSETAALAAATALAALANENALLASFLQNEDPKGEFPRVAREATETSPSTTTSLLSARERRDVVAATVDALRSEQRRQRAASARHAGELSSAHDQAEAWLAEVRRDAYAFRREVVLPRGGTQQQQQQEQSANEKKAEAERLGRFFRRRAAAYRAAVVRMRNRLAVARAETARLGAELGGSAAGEVGAAARGGAGAGGTTGTAAGAAAASSSGPGAQSASASASRVDLERLRLETRDLRAQIAGAAEEVEALKAAAAREEACGAAARRDIAWLEARGEAARAEAEGFRREAAAAAKTAAALMPLASSSAGGAALGAGCGAWSAGAGEERPAGDGGVEAPLPSLPPPRTDDYVAAVNEAAALETAVATLRRKLEQHQQRGQAKAGKVARPL